MGQTIFTTKKMKLESKSWIQKTLIGTIIVAILGAGGFGAYMLVSDSQSESSQSTRHQASKHSRSSASQAMLPAYAKQNDPFASLGGSKGSSTSKVAKHSATQSKASKGKKVASTHGKKAKKHLSKKHTKGGKHKIAAHKKHGKKHVAHQKHAKKKKTAHKKHKSGHKIAQR